MNTIRFFRTIGFFGVLMMFPFCSSSKQNIEEAWLQNAIERSEQQLLLAAETFKDSLKNPRTFKHGVVELVSHTDWTSGFFPGCLWYLYELTGNEELKKAAERSTEFIEQAQFRTNTHDLGFIIHCSYGNGYRITGNENYRKVMEQGAKSLMTRYNAKIGLIRSWDFGTWQFPVIIDNMMNLEFLYELGTMTGNQAMIDAAVSHANITLVNHFRPDNSCVHVVDYDPVSGEVILKETHQGYSDDSSWARGQAWALYGYTMMYRLTNKIEYLQQAEKVAEFILNHPRLPEDKIPYWDFDAPNIANESRDASAAAIIASALFELSTCVNNVPAYFNNAEIILKNLSSEPYLAKTGENGLFILKHSTGNWPKNSEIDRPLSYADYYYVEALKRYVDLVGR
ncbi:MAG: glycoside hydrolase family 88 protein [Paludibacter sp.]|nr:glycoside hydrolase family 88 protein [Paludibacter sp.]